MIVSCLITQGVLLRNEGEISKGVVQQPTIDELRFFLASTSFLCVVRILRHLAVLLKLRQVGMEA